MPKNTHHSTSSTESCKCQQQQNVFEQTKQESTHHPAEPPFTVYGLVLMVLEIIEAIASLLAWMQFFMYHVYPVYPNILAMIVRALKGFLKWQKKKRKETSTNDSHK